MAPPTTRSLSRTAAPSTGAAHAPANETSAPSPSAPGPPLPPHSTLRRPASRRAPRPWRRRGS